MIKPLSLFATLALSLAASLPVSAEEKAPRVRVTPIDDSLYMLSGRGGNLLASVGSDGVLLIDADYGELAEAHAAAIAGLPGSQGAPRFLLNTHWHGDHSGGNAYWGERGTVIMAHENIYQRMSTRQEIKALGWEVEPSPAAALPQVTYRDAIALRFNGDTIQVQHFPRGHTDGDSIVFFTGASVVHMGDHYFAGAFPFIDIDSGGNALGYIANVEKVLEMTDDYTVFVPGHGSSPMTRGELRAWVDMLKASISEVSALLKAGKSVDEIAERGLGPAYQSYGQGFIDEPAWISFIAASI